ncbi:helicase, partial [bacterium CPR1]|nr:helicase [bacterium CPR1]
EAILAVPRAGQERQEQAAFPAGAAGVLHLVVDSEQLSPVNPTDLSTDRIQIDTVEPRSMPAAGYHTVSVSFTALAGVSAEDLDRWYSDRLEPALGRWVRLVCARPSRPGYFVRPATNPRGQEKDWSIEIYCPAPDCPLSGLPWREQVPVPLGVRKPPSCDGWQQVFTPYRSQKDETIGIRVPIPAVMVDEQIYSWPPTLLVSTVDKFARLPYEPRAASLFGQVELYHPREGYYRQHCVREKGRDHPTFPDLRREVKPLRPPDLILQDELHLIDGPLGSMMGIYETAVDVLCSRLARPKYIASTATVREAREQVQALFARSLTQFPAPGLSASDSFFALVRPGDPRQEAGSGRLYLGFLAPAKGALTPIVRLWAILLQSTAWLENMGVETDSLDPYWTTVGYFNAVRELAGVTGLLRQDVPQWRNHLEPREREEIDEPVELSSRMDSQRLPASLARLERPYPDAERAVLATSMFGTGVDVPRLSLMIVHGQPKTTSAYIQATGRVGRAAPGLIVTAFRASRPRDLDHYEFFTGYHGQLYRGVEPVTVFPFSPRARERALGPLCVALLRNAGELAGRPVSSHWCREPGGATHMVQGRVSDEVAVLASIFERRSTAQPDNRQPSEQAVQREVEAALDLWRQ